MNRTYVPIPRTADATNNSAIPRYWLPHCLWHWGGARRAATPLHTPPTHPYSRWYAADNEQEAPATSGALWRHPGNLLPRLRCAAWPALLPATARPYSCVGQRMSTSHLTLIQLVHSVALSKVADWLALFFASLAMVMRATPVARLMLRCELRSTNSLSTCA